MALYLYHGNDLKSLAEKLTSLLFKELSDPFSLETVVVPDGGFAKWLSLEIAKSRGLCPQIDFVRPGRFLYSHVFNPMRNVSSDKDLSTFVPEVLVWEIYEWLKDSRYDCVTEFVRSDELKRWQLAKRLTRLFDKYMTCRQDMLQAWEYGKTACDHSHEAWQRELWSSLIRGRDDYFSAVCQAFMNMPADDFKPDKDRFYVFGVSSLPLCHVEVMLKLAESADIHFFMFNPCETLWNDVKNAKSLLKEKFAVESEAGKSLSAFYDYQCNPLLGAMGGQGRDFFSMMLEHAWDNEAGSFFYKSDVSRETSLLRQIRLDIQQNVLRKEIRDGESDSLSVHVCHSAMREVEVLKDQLIRAFKEIEGLEPEDIRVLLPSPSEYAPFIDVVFGDVSDNPLPYVIADKSLIHEHLECQAFLKLLTVVRGRFKASEVLDLLSFECVRASFGLDENDVREAAALLKQAHLAWGVDGAFKGELGASDEYMHTWTFALDRLILGASMSGPMRSGVSLKCDVCIPEPSAEGNSRIAGALAELIDQLMQLRVKCNCDTLKSTSEWMAVLKHAVSVFFRDERSDGVCALQRSLAELQKNVELSRVAHLEFPFTVLMNQLQESMESSSASENVVSGRITFCKFKTLGSVPAKVVCMLGMNDGAYPRVERRLGFDLSMSEHRLGDASVKDEDRFAFLEAVLSASERLIVCYTGRSQKDNSEIPPAIVVSELLDNVSLYCPEYKERVIVEHPLHPFSPRYFAKGRPAALVNYSQPNFNIARHINAEDQVPAGDSVRMVLPASVETLEINLDQLHDFLSAPVSCFYKNRVGVSVDIQESDIPSDDEPFHLGPLEAYSLNRTLFDVVLDGDNNDFDVAFETMYRSGALPVYSDDIRSKAEEMSRKFIEKLSELEKADPVPAERLSIIFKNSRLIVFFRSCFKNGKQIFLRPSGEKGKDVLKAALYHLAWCAVKDNEGFETLSLSYDKSKTEVNCSTYKSIDASMARSKLEKLIEWFVRGQCRPLCFDMNVCWDAVDKKRNEFQPEQVNNKWGGNSFSPGSGAEKVARDEFGNELSEACLAEFKAVAQDVLDAIQEVRL